MENILRASAHVSPVEKDDSLGQPETALIVPNESKRSGHDFYILKGNHLEAYRAIVPQGLEACMEYYRTNLALRSRFSDDAILALGAKLGVTESGQTVH
jgi:hypothetical protein